MIKISKNTFRISLGIAFAFFLYFHTTPVSFAASVSPSTIYPGTSYTVSESITNSSSVAITVHNDWFYSVDGGGLNGGWCSQDNTVPANSTITVSCGSTGDVVGTVMNFQVNTWWNPWTVTSSTAGFTVQARPVTYNIQAGTNTSFCSGCGTAVTAGTQVTVYASNPPSGYQFSSWGWSGGSNPCSSAGSSSCSFSASQSGTASVNFSPIAPTTYTLSTSVSGGSGTISGGGTYNSGTVVSVTQSPSNWYQFSGWGGACTGTGSCSVVMNGNKSVTATFSQTPASFSLSNFSVCDASSGGNCGSTLYGNGTAYYSVTVNNNGGSDGTFSGYYTLGGSKWTGKDISTFVSGQGGSAQNVMSNDSGVGTYAIGACNSAGEGCVGGGNYTFIGPPSLGASASTVTSGDTLIFTAFTDAGVTSSFSLYTCGDGNAPVSTNGASFTCRYTNTGSSGVQRQATIKVTQGSASRTVGTFITVNPVPPFNYSLSNSGATSITLGSSATVSISSSLISATSQAVTLSASGLPSGMTASFGTNPVTPSGGSTLTISASKDTTPGNYTITVTGSPLGKTTSFTATVSVPAPHITTASSNCTAVGNINYHVGNTFGWSNTPFPTGTTFKIYIAPGETGATNDLLTSGIPPAAFTQQLRNPTATVNVSPAFPSSSYTTSIEELSYRVSAVVNGVESAKSDNFVFMAGAEDAGQCFARIETSVPTPTLTATLTATPSSVVTGAVSNLTTMVGGFATGPIIYSNHKCDSSGTIPATAISGGSFSCSYSAGGTFTASVTVARQGLTTSPTTNITVATPNLTVGTPSVSGTSPVPGKTNTFYTGSSVTLTANVSNNAVRDITETFQNRFRYTTETGAGDASGDLPLSNVLKSGSKPVSVTLTNVTPGVFTLFLRADTGGAVSESNEGDNDGAGVVVTIESPPIGTAPTPSCPAGEDVIASFATPGTQTWTVPAGLGSARVKIWGGGGGGGCGTDLVGGGIGSCGRSYGGGGGGYTEKVLSSLASSYSITVGGGGVGQLASLMSSGGNVTRTASQGTNSSLGSLVAYGSGGQLPGNAFYVGGTGDTANGGAGGQNAQTMGGGGGGGSGGSAGADSPSFSSAILALRGSGGAGGNGVGRGGDGAGGVAFLGGFQDCRDAQNGTFPGGGGGGPSLYFSSPLCGSYQTGGDGGSGMVLICGVVQPNLTANKPTLVDQCGNTSALLAGEVKINGTVSNNSTVDTANGLFSNQYQYRLTGASIWNELKTISLTTTGSITAGTNRGTTEHSWIGGLGAWEFQLFADSGGAVSESSEADNYSTVTSVPIVDFTPTLTATPSAFYNTQSTTLKASVTGGDATGAITYSAPTCGGGVVATNINLSAGTFNCKYSAPGPYSPSITVARAPSTSAGATSACVKKPTTASVTVNQLYKPKVNLWISPAGEPCGTSATAQIVKGLKGTLCWSVTPVTVP